MQSYMSQLMNKAQSLDIELLAAFRKAGVPTSTFYRTINGTTDLRYDTALKIYKAMHGKEESTDS